MLIEFHHRGHGVFDVHHRGRNCGALLHERDGWRATVTLPGGQVLPLFHARRHQVARALILLTEAIGLELIE